MLLLEVIFENCFLSFFSKKLHLASISNLKTIFHVLLFWYQRKQIFHTSSFAPLRLACLCLAQGFLPLQAEVAHWKVSESTPTTPPPLIFILSRPEQRLWDCLWRLWTISQRSVLFAWLLTPRLPLSPVRSPWCWRRSPREESLPPII